MTGSRTPLLVAALLALGGLATVGVWLGTPTPVVVTLGFCLLFGTLLAALLARFHLPRLLGYVTAGAILGPRAGDLLDVHGVEQLSTLSDLALAALAFLVGTRLPTRGLGRLTARALRLVGAQWLVLIPTLGLTMVVVTGLTGSLVGHPGQLVVVALALAIPLCAPSSALVLGVLRERDEVQAGAEGPGSDRTGPLFSAVVAAEVLTVAALAVLVMIAVATGMSWPSGAQPSKPPMLEALALALAIGLVTAALVVPLVRFNRPWNMAGLAALLGGGQLLCASMGAPTFVCFATAGVVASIASQRVRTLGSALWQQAWPILAVFFVVLGVEAPMAAATLPAALLVVAVRGAGLHLGTRLGRWHAEVCRALPSQAQLAFFGQGATVFLLAKWLAPLLPVEGLDLLREVARFHLLLGAVAAQAGLASVRSLTEAQPETVTPKVAPIDAVTRPTFEDVELEEAFEHLEASLQSVVERLRDRVVAPRTDSLARFIESLGTSALAGLERIERSVQSEESPDQLEVLVEDVRSDLLTWIRHAIDEHVADQDEVVRATRLRPFLSAVDRLIEEQPTLIVRMEPARYRARANDGLWIRTVKWSRRTGRRLSGWLGTARVHEREVPIADLAAFHLGGRFGTDLIIAADALAAQRNDLWLRMRLLVEHIDAVFSFALEACGSGQRPPLEGLEAARQEVTEELGVAERSIRLAGDQVASRLGRRLNELLADTARAARIAGTVELPRFRYRPLRVAEARRDQHNDLADHRAAWDDVVRGTAGALALRIEGEQVLGRYHAHERRVLRTLQEETLGPLLDYPSAVAEQCEEVQEQLAAAFADAELTMERLRELVSEKETYLEGFVSRIAVGEMTEALEPHRVNRPFDDFYEVMERTLLDLPKSFTIRSSPWDPVAGDAQPPAAELIEFPFRELAREVLKDEVRLRFQDRQKQVGLALRDALADLSELVHYLAFHFEATLKAIGGDEPDRDGAREVLLVALGEATLRTTRLSTQGGQRASELLDELRQVFREQAGTFLTILMQGQVEEARRRSGHVDRRERERDKVAQARVRSIRRLVGSAVGERFDATLRGVQTRLGMTPDQSRTELVELTAEAGFEHFEKRGIPRSYRRLFETATFGVEDILAGQEAELEAIARAVKRWKSGMATQVAIVGERGGGRTTLVERALRRHFSDARVHRRSLAARFETERDVATELSTLLFGRSAARLSTIEQRLGKRTGRSVIVLEGLQHMMLRTYDGVGPLTEFLDFVGRAGADVLWLVTVDAAAWHFMDTFFGASERLSDVVQIGRLSRDEMEQLVTRRHQVSGFNLEFRLGGGSGHLPRIRRGSHEAARQRYFDALYDVSRGHPVTTMFRWLDSILDVEARSKVIVGWPRDVRSALLEHLDTKRLLDLAAIMMHGTLSSDELARVGRMSPKEAAAVFGQLRALNLVERVAGTVDTYTVNPVLYGPLFDGLRERSMI